MPIFLDDGSILRPREPLKVKSFDPDRQTPAQRVYVFIVEFKRQHDGNSPTIREIMTACKVSSSSMVFFYLNQLAAFGLIQRPEPQVGTRQAANIEVVGGKWIFIGGHHE
jgi:hypothetical protein